MANPTIQEQAMRAIQATIDQDPDLFARGFETGVRKATDLPNGDLIELTDVSVPGYHEFDGTEEELANRDRIYLVGVMCGAVAVQSGLKESVGK